MARMKEFSGDPVKAKRDDGLTEAQLANYRALYEDTPAYAEWRIKVGLAKAPEPRDNPYMREKVSRLFRDLADGLGEPFIQRRRQNWQMPKEEALDRLDALQDRYADEPVRLSHEALSRFVGDFNV